MNKLRYLFLTIVAIATNTHPAELHLDSINNQTVHKIAWEKLPLPGMLGKMRPDIIDRFGSVQPRMPLILPVTFSFKNPGKPSQAVLLEMKLARRLLKRRPRPGEDPKKYEFIELMITLMDSQRTVLNRWSERIEDTRSYKLIVTIKGLNLQKTDVAILEKEA